MQNRVRIEDVAARVGVSPKTVSRVLNNEPNVSELTRIRVLEGCRELDYLPNRSARSLASQRSFLIALLYDNPSPHYVLEVQRGVLDACDAHGYAMMVRPLMLDAPDFLRRVEVLILQSRPDGLILTPPICDDTRLCQLLRTRAVPFASISPRKRDRCTSIAMDERSAAAAMVQHLVALGHRRIAHVTGPTSHGASSWRLRGYSDGLAKAGLKVDPALVVRGGFSFDSGVTAARHLFALQPRPTAVFAGNDDTAAGVLWAAAEQGLRVPENISVCGFDDTPLSRHVWPALTTVSQPTSDMGRLVTQQLLHVITTDRIDEKTILLPFTLRPRGSTGPAPL